MTVKTIYFDTETTGLEPDEDQIIELALLTFSEGKLTEEYDKLIKINNGGELSEDITNLTGITPEQLGEEGISEADAAEDLYQRITQDTPIVMIAHNTQFDLLFISSLLKKYYPAGDIDKYLSRIYWLDTLTIFKDRAGYPHKLKDMVNHYNLEEDYAFHRAIDDARALHGSVMELLNERNDLKEYINLFGYNPKYGVTGEKFPWITYRKQPYHNGLKKYEIILPRVDDNGRIEYVVKNNERVWEDI